MADKIFGNNELALYAVWLLTALAALNWGLVEFAQFNLLSDGLGLSNDVLSAAYGAIGVAGAIALWNTVTVDIMEGM